MTAQVNIELRNNEDWRDTFVLTDNSVSPIVPIDLSDATLTMHVRENASDVVAVFIASTQNGKIEIIPGSLFRVEVPDGGSGYTSAPDVVFSGGGDDVDKVLPEAIAVLTDGVVSSIEITSRGERMSVEPTISITGGGGTGATASAVLGPVCSIDVDWAEIAHISGSYHQDLILNVGDLRKAIWAGTLNMEEGVTK